MKTDIADTAKKGYFAGLVDGEGCIAIKRYAPRGKGLSPAHALCLVIEMADPRPVKAFGEFFGLKIRISKRNQRNKNSLKYRPLYVAQACAQQTCLILKELMPYLIAKQEQAKLVIEFYGRCYLSQDHHCAGRNGKVVPQPLMELREQYYSRLKALKHQKFTTP